MVVCDEVIYESSRRRGEEDEKVWVGIKKEGGGKDEG